MSITLYTWKTPNGRKVSIALEEMGLPYTAKSIDITRDEQFAPEFLAVAPNNKIPAIIDPDGPEGDLPLFESGAILLYLAEKTGQFLPSGGRARAKTLEWLMWQMGGYGPMLGQTHHFLRFAKEDVPYGKKRFGDETRRLYGVLDARLGEVPYVAGEAYTVADMAIYPWTHRHEWHGIDLTDFPNVLRWYEVVGARPAVQKGMAVPE